MGADHSSEKRSAGDNKHRRTASATTATTSSNKPTLPTSRDTAMINTYGNNNSNLPPTPSSNSASSSSSHPSSISSSPSNAAFPSSLSQSNHMTAPNNSTHVNVQSQTTPHATAASTTPPATADDKPSFKRAQTAPAPRILISVQPPSTEGHAVAALTTPSIPPTTLSSDTVSPPSPTLASQSSQSSSIPSKRNQYLSLDYLPSSVTSSFSPPHSVPETSSLLVSSTSPLSAPSSGSGSAFGSSNSSLSLAAVVQRDVPSATSSGSNSSSNSPKIAASLRDHHAFFSTRRQPNMTTALSNSANSFNNKSPNSPSFPSSPPHFSSSLSDAASSTSSEPKTPLPTRETVIVHTQTNAAGQKQINQYVIESGDIGRGSYGIVKLVYNVEDQTHYAMKIMNKSLLKKRRIMGFTQGSLSRATSVGTPSSASVAAAAALSATGASPIVSPSSYVDTGAARTSVPATPTSAASDHWTNVQREIAIMKKLDHQNIVRLYEVMDDPSTDNLYLIMEYMNHGSVMSGDIDKLHALPLETCWHYFRDVVLGLEYLHFQKVIHRDLKPENLLISSTGLVKISDFGVSMLLEGNNDMIQTGSTTVGSAAFMPPELCGGAGIGSGGATLGSGSGGIPSATTKAAIISPSNANQPTQSLLDRIAAQMRIEQEAKDRGVAFDIRSFSLPAAPLPSPHAATSEAGGYNARRPSHLRTYSSDMGSPALVSGKKGDIWSLGITLYVMAFGSLPFMATTVALIYRSIVESALVFPAPDDKVRNPNGISEATEEGADLFDLLRKLLDKNPHTRLDIQEIKQHPWVTRRGLEPMDEQCDYDSENGNNSIIPLSSDGSTASTGSTARRVSLSTARRAARAKKIAEREERRKAREAAGAAGTMLDPTQEEDEVDEEADTEEMPTEDEEDEAAVAAEAEEEVKELPVSTITSNDNNASSNSGSLSARRLSKRISVSGSYQPINVSNEDMTKAVTLVSRVVLVVKLKAKMRRHRLQLEAQRAGAGMRDRSNSVGDISSSDVKLDKPRLIHQSSCPAVGASTPLTVASPGSASVGDTPHGSASHGHFSKRSAHATFALLSAARGAINAGTRGEEAAKAWNAQSAPTSDYEDDASDTTGRSSPSSVAAQPMKRLLQMGDDESAGKGSALPTPYDETPTDSSEATSSRLPLFPHRKNSQKALPPRLGSAAILADQPVAGTTPEGGNARHQSAPLRSPPALYVPLANLAQQPQSLSLSNLESDDVSNEVVSVPTSLSLTARQLRHRTAYAVTDADAHAIASMDALILPRAMLQQSQAVEHNIDSDDDSFEEGEVASVEPDTELLDI